MAIPSGTRLGVYEVVAQIGAGGMGEVYRARDTRLQRDVALKVLPEVFARDTERMARFEREAKLLASLNHPNIAAIYGLEESGPIRALVMELVEGPTLAERIRGGAIPVDEALPVARQVADAVEYAHDKNVIHRDLKPANIKVTPEGTVKVLDFGLAKALSDEVAAEDMSNSPTLSMAATRQGVILGTAAYMSPEQAKGKSVDRRADVWAFGAVLCEMLTGKQAFPGEDITEVLAAVVRAEPDWSLLPSSTPPAICALLRRCLEKNVRRRLQHAGEARILIEDVLSGGAPATAEGAPAPSTTSKGQQWVHWTATVFFAAALAALSFVHFREVPPQPPMLRFDIAPPEKTVLSMFKISPDGRYVAMALLQDGKNQLWLRSLDSLEAKPLPGTDDAAYPFWSPDSSYVGFFAQGKLKKISVNGGPAQTICDAPGGRGGAWNRNGIIVFAPNINGGLSKVSAAGGLPVTLTTLTTQGATDSHRFPEFILGGDTFTFVYITEKPETTGIYIGSMEGKPPVRILPDLSNSAYVAPIAPGQSGHLLFIRENTLMAQPFDPDRLRTAGEAIPLVGQVAGGVGFAITNGNGDFSASETGLLAYRAGGVLADRDLVWMDREGRRISTVGKPASIISEALSPDEKNIVLTIPSPTKDSDLWLEDLNRGVLSRFTFEPRFSDAPVWSPDNRFVAFMFRPTTGTAYRIARKPVMGDGKQEILATGRINAAPWDWSPDGKFIIYSDTGEKTNYDLFLLPLAGDRKPVAFLQTQFNETHAQFSPDGRWMAYSSDESGRAEVYVQPIPLTGAKWQISASGGGLPRWRKDGKELYYVATDGKVMAVPVRTGATADDFQTGPAQSLFAVPVLNPGAINARYPYQSAADGKRFLVNVPAGGEGDGEPPITMTLNWTGGLKE
jgi:eukaryotic-like serine/threonine-protein kinase